MALKRWRPIGVAGAVAKNNARAAIHPVFKRRHQLGKALLLHGIGMVRDQQIGSGGQTGTGDQHEWIRRVQVNDIRGA